MHAAGVVRAIKEEHPSASFFGIGGDAMRDAGVEVLHDVNDMAAIGFAEILPKLYASFHRHIPQYMSNDHNGFSLLPPRAS
jgi:lipid A disaccharide synthetase